MLIIGDGCTDDSEEVVTSFGDERLLWHNLPQNTGNQSAPNNAGLELARGKYVAYLGHDDLWYPTHLNLLANALKNSGADIAHTCCVYIGPPESGTRFLTGISGSGEHERTQWTPPSSIMHRRDAIGEIGGWKDYRAIELPPDQELWIRAWDSGKRFAPVHELTVFKFPSSWRRNSYRDKPSFEQAEYARRIQAEPDFLYREAWEIATAYFTHRPEWPPDIPKPDSNRQGPGVIVNHWRQLRGLDPL